jgi:hypothetical protein
MKSNQLGLFFKIASFWISFSCSSSKNSNLTGKKEKFFVQPVCLSVKGIERDTSIRRLFEEAFSKYKVQLISDEEMKIRSEKDAMRVGRRVFSKDSKFDNPEDLIRAMGREHKYVSNMLSVSLEIHDKEDSLMIYKAWWSNIPFPPDFSRVYVTKQREINLTNLSHSIKGDIYSIVDSILYSNELK